MAANTIVCSDAGFYVKTIKRKFIDNIYVYTDKAYEATIMNSNQAEKVIGELGGGFAWKPWEESVVKKSGYKVDLEDQYPTRDAAVRAYCVVKVWAEHMSDSKFFQKGRTAVTEILRKNTDVMSYKEACNTAKLKNIELIQKFIKSL